MGVYQKDGKRKIRTATEHTEDTEEFCKLMKDFMLFFFVQLRDFRGLN